MSEVWENLSKSYLIDLIGEENLEFAEEILPELAREIGRDYNDFINITNKKSKLAELFQASAMSASIGKKDFREELISRLPPADIDKLKSAFGLSDFDKLKKHICSTSWSKNEIIEKFCEELQISPNVIPEEIKKVPDIQLLNESPEAISSFKQLKDYQMSVIIKANEKLETNLSRFVIQMPTGAGKTRVAMELVCDALKKYENENVNIVWLANRAELLEQAYFAFNEVWPHLSNKKIELIRFFGSSKNNFNKVNKSSLAICGLDKLTQELKNNPKSLDNYIDNIRLIIFDEAHGTVAPTYNKTVVKLMSKKCNLIGLSATPGRVDDQEQEHLVSFYGNSLVELDCRGENPIAYLKSKKVLSETTVEFLEITPEFQFTQKEIDYIQENLRMPQSALDNLSKEKIRNIEIIKKIKEECDQNKKIIVFAIDLKHSKRLNTILNFIGIKSAHIDGTTANRKYILENFRTNKLQVLCNGDLLAEGFDDPQIDVVVIARPVGSPGLKLQMIGRGLRGPQMGGTEFCKIIDVRDNLNYIPDVDIYENFSDYFKSIEN